MTGRLSRALHNCVLCPLLLLVLGSETIAADFIVDTTSDTSGVPGDTSLRDAIKPAGTLRLENVQASGFQSGPAGSVIDGKEFATGQSAPYALEIVDSHLHDNDGDAVYGSFTSVLIENTAIADNSSDGVNLVDGYPFVVSDSTVTGNGGVGLKTTGQGYPVNGMTVTNTIASNNADVGVSCGGCGTVIIEDATITDNGGVAAFHRGGIDITTFKRLGPDHAVISISGSTITGNTSQTDGGGLHVGENVDEGGIAPVVTIEASTIDNNSTLLNGGGVAIPFGRLELVDSSISGNDAQADGGGLWLTDPDMLDLVITNATIDDNVAQGNGGGVHIDPAMSATISHTSISGNTAATNGGVWLMAMTGTVSDSHISMNTAVNGAGGLRFRGDGLVVERSTLAGNSAPSANGGGIGSEAFLSTVVRNSTLVDNEASAGGGIGVFDGGNATIEASTLTGNAGTPAHVFQSPPSGLTISGSILAEPITGVVCSSPGTTSHNMLADASCGASGSDSVSAADPQLGPLADNGGPTPTRLPSAASAAVNLVPLTHCALSLDQRGENRPGGVACDADADGSVDLEPPGPTLDALWTLTRAGK